jgi:hypothetical protein
MMAIGAIVVIAIATRPAHAGCHEVSDVVGLHRCKAFGETWSGDAHSDMGVLEVGYYFRHFTAAPFTLGDTARMVTGTEALAATARGVELRGGYAINPLLYIGGEADFGDLVRKPKLPGTQVATGTNIVPLAVVGIHLYERVRISLSAELAGGARYDTFSTCDMAPCPTAHEWHGELEGRARADWFVLPTVSLAIMLGKSLVDDDRMVAIGLALHGRILDGVR